MLKAFVIGFIAGVALLIVGGVAGFQSRQNSPEQLREQQELALYQKEIVDATPAQLNVFSERQRAHSKLYSHYAQVKSDKTISSLISQAQSIGKSKIVETGIFVGLEEVLPETTAEKYFAELANASDIVIRGTVKSKSSQITEDEAFIFSDYDIIVTEILRNDGAAPLNTGQAIVVTRPGGKVLLNDYIVKAIDHSFEMLPVNKNEVILFLKFIAETGAYQATSSNGCFELDGSKLRPLTERPFPPGVLQDGRVSLKKVRLASVKQ